MGIELGLVESKNIYHIHDHVASITNSNMSEKDHDKVDSILYTMDAYVDKEIKTQSAYLMARLVKDHIFYDCNKRTAYFSMLLMMTSNGHNIVVPDKKIIASVVEDIAQAPSLDVAFDKSYDFIQEKSRTCDAIGTYNEFFNTYLKNISFSK